jgi:hypothetical protein
MKVQGANVVAAYEMVRCEEIRCLCDQRCAVEFFHDSFKKVLLPEMVDRRVQGAEEVM